MIKISDHLIFVSNERRVLYHFSGKHTFKVLQDFAYIPIRLLAKRKLSIAFLVGFTRSFGHDDTIANNLSKRYYSDYRSNHLSFASFGHDDEA